MWVRVLNILNLKWGKFTTTFNNLVDAHNEREDDVEWIKAKLADLEDRSRHNNVKIHDIKETIKPTQGIFH